MRQQFLAYEMEKANEIGVDIVSLLHIAPAHNLDFRKITSPALNQLGNSPTEIWSNLVKDKARFKSVHTETLFGGFSIEKMPKMNEWSEYLQERYRLKKE